MKTAVEWFEQQLDNLDIEIPQTIFEQAKELEKQQIFDAFNESRLTHPMIGFKHKTFEEYYNQT